MNQIGPFPINKTHEGDCLELIPQLPDESVNIVVTSPPYWGQRHSEGIGIEKDPRDYLRFLTKAFVEVLPKLRPEGLLWINMGDAYNTPVNWNQKAWKFSTLGAKKQGFSEDNSAYTKPRAQRKAFIDKDETWLQYGNLLALPYRLIIALCEAGYLFRGEVIWRKKNAMPEGRCRRPHRQHESIYLLTKSERHGFRVTPPIKSVWEFANEKIDGLKHFSRFPKELPIRCIKAYGTCGEDVVVLDPFSGSGTTGIAALTLGCSYIGFEVDPEQVQASNKRLEESEGPNLELFPKSATLRNDEPSEGIVRVGEVT